MTYLDIASAQTYLPKIGITKFDSECLEEWIAVTENLIDEWLGKHLGIQEYIETHSANHKGLIILRHGPVVDLIQVCTRDLIIYHKDESYPIQSSVPQVTWNGSYNIQTNSCECDPTVYEVTYTAGIDCPPIARAVAKSILKIIAQNQGDITTLMESPREIEEVQNATVGGTFKQRFKRTSAVQGTTLLDRLMKPLERYRKKYRT